MNTIGYQDEELKDQKISSVGTDRIRSLFDRPFLDLIYQAASGFIENISTLRRWKKQRC